MDRNESLLHISNTVRAVYKRITKESKAFEFVFSESEAAVYTVHQITSLCDRRLQGR